MEKWMYENEIKKKQREDNDMLLFGFAKKWQKERRQL